MRHFKKSLELAEQNPKNINIKINIFAGYKRYLIFA
jgi:hypothetical protein